MAHALLFDRHPESTYSHSRLRDALAAMDALAADPVRPLVVPLAYSRYCERCADQPCAPGLALCQRCYQRLKDRILPHIGKLNPNKIEAAENRHAAGATTP